MKHALMFAFVLFFAVNLYSQGPGGKSFGFGLILGEPVGATIKYWTDKDNAFVGDIGGNSYYGSLRVSGDYLWHFNAFNSQIVNMYAGPGVVLGLGDSFGGGWWYKGRKWEYTRGSAAIGVRGIFGINIIPRRTPLEIFLEVGPLISISPGVFSTLDAAVGVRFYP